MSLVVVNEGLLSSSSLAYRMRSLEELTSKRFSDSLTQFKRFNASNNSSPAFGKIKHFQLVFGPSSWINIIISLKCFSAYWERGLWCIIYIGLYILQQKFKNGSTFKTLLLLISPFNYYNSKERNPTKSYNVYTIYIYSNIETGFKLSYYTRGCIYFMIWNNYLQTYE